MYQTKQADYSIVYLLRLRMPAVQVELLDSSHVDTFFRITDDSVS